MTSHSKPSMVAPDSTIRAIHTRSNSVLIDSREGGAMKMATLIKQGARDLWTAILFQRIKLKHDMHMEMEEWTSCQEERCQESFRTSSQRSRVTSLITNWWRGGTRTVKCSTKSLRSTTRNTQAIWAMIMSHSHMTLGKRCSKLYWGTVRQQGTNVTEICKELPKKMSRAASLTLGIAPTTATPTIKQTSDSTTCQTGLTSRQAAWIVGSLKETLRHRLSNNTKTSEKARKPTNVAVLHPRAR